MSRICLIDAKNFLYRNHYTHRELRGPNGEPTSVLYGCMAGLLALGKRLPDTPFVFVWDGGGETWRHRFLYDHKRAEPEPPKQATDWVGKQVAASLRFIRGQSHHQGPRPEPAAGMTPKCPPVGYKANRVAAANDEDKTVAVSQIPELKKTLRGLGLRNFKVSGLEGDDLMGILASAIINRKLFDQVIIHSSDTDFYQLLSRNILILKQIGMDGQLRWVDQANVMTRFNVDVSEWTKYRALTGDVTDNIPKLLRNVGPVRAVKLLRAGVDASNIHHWQPSAVNALLDMTKGQLDIEDFKKRLRKNYIACQILTEENFVAPMMGEELGTRIAGVLSLICREALLRDERGLTQEAYREFCDWCTSHGMAGLRDRANEFAGLV